MQVIEEPMKYDSSIQATHLNLSQKEDFQGKRVKTLVEVCTLLGKAKNKQTAAHECLALNLLGSALSHSFCSIYIYIYVHKNHELVRFEK